MPDNCDHCGRLRALAQLVLYRNSHLNLCQGCWAKEMVWRRIRNVKLLVANKFEILPWPLSQAEPEKGES